MQGTRFPVGDALPLLLFDTSNFDGRLFLESDVGLSCSNKGESLLAWQYVGLLASCNVNMEDVAIITPYKGQVRNYLICFKPRSQDTESHKQLEGTGWKSDNSSFCWGLGSRGPHLMPAEFQTRWWF